MTPGSPVPLTLPGGPEPATGSTLDEKNTFLRPVHVQARARPGAPEPRTDMGGQGTRPVSTGASGAPLYMPSQ